jgi:hypothetical protein
VPYLNVFPEKGIIEEFSQASTAVQEGFLEKNTALRGSFPTRKEPIRCNNYAVIQHLKRCSYGETIFSNGEPP